MRFRVFCVFLHFFVLLPYPFLLFMCNLCFTGSLFFVYCGSIFDIERKKQPPVLRKFNDCAIVLTTVYPTSGIGTDGDNENKSVKEDVLLSKKS